MENPSLELEKPTLIDLFCGAGGFSLGFEKAGFNVIGAVDNHIDPIKTYLFNRGDFRKKKAIFIKDIKDLKGESLIKATSKMLREKKNIDVVIGGPPCQGFSIRGKRKKDDKRNLLVNEFFRIVNEIKPKFFVFENVSGLLSEKYEYFLKSIIRRIEKMKYCCSIDILNASDYGVPQNRRRLFIIGSRVCDKLIFPKKLEKKKNSEFYETMNIIPPIYNVVPTIKDKINISDAISDIAYKNIKESPINYKKDPESNYQKIIRCNSKELYNHVTTRHSKSTIEVFKRLNSGQNMTDLPTELRPNRRSCKRMDPFEVSRTITSCNEDLIHYSLNRIITIREMARLQSFPDDYIFKGVRTTGGNQRKYSCCQVQQVGNSVPPLLSQAIAESILLMLNMKSNKKFTNFIKILNANK